jgi:murein DD-endopeptidase MepM/ murein hydrolase activator NlpD
LPDLRRLYRRFTDSPLPTRFVAHLSVVSLVALATAAGLSQGSSGGDPVAHARAAVAFPAIVPSVHAAGLPSPEAGADVYSLAALPVDIVQPINRGAPALIPPDPEAAPLPTPVAVDPNATPLAAPTGIGQTASAPTQRSTSAPAPAAGRLLWPVPGGAISQYFHAGHLALDIAAPYGSMVVAAQSGIVTWSGWRNNGGGYVISIDHGNGLVTVYNHLGSLWVSPGAYVAAGQGIAGVGCTGICTGPHVHFEVIVNGIIDNPQRYF